MWYNCLGLHECGGCSSTVGERECGKSGLHGCGGCSSAIGVHECGKCGIII